ncbi:glycosyltransferase [Petrocella sp. FN5]|uniref:glycosyltransferase n=1 Tax=Petrocella sp. FN5 TaxID=3032002 RepID=UPI0023DA27DB|nr:glycosyltransferase [Petrocella sp. FN5]MDF1616145.1 glycosyltransferase [Petrocella sp. FN5]
MKKDKIVCIIPSISTGGAEKMVIDLANNIDSKNFEVYLISLYSKKNNVYEDLIDEDRVRLIYLNKKSGIDVKTFIKLFNELKKIKPSVIHTHLNAAIYSIPWKVFNANVGWIHTIHNEASKEMPRLYLGVMKLMYKRGIATPIAISNLIKNSIKDYYGISDKIIPLIYNCIDTKYFKPNHDNDEMFKNNVTKLCCVARFSYQKNHSLLLEAFSIALKQVSDLELTLVGDGELRTEIEEKIVALSIGDKVKLVGNTNNVVKYLQQSDLFILSSRYEGLPLSVLEAMATGLGIIAPEVGGIPDVVSSGEEGILVKPNDLQSLSSAIVTLATNHQLLSRMKENAYRKSKDFDVKIMSKLYEEEYHTCVKLKN